jgi:hypothetical protein
MGHYDSAGLELDDDIFSLGAAVGPRRRNRCHDVLKVETLLANTGDHDLEDGPTGYAGAQLDQAIRAYQQRRGLAVDGVLEPGGETIAALARELGPRLAGFRAPRPDEADDHLNRSGRGEEPLFDTKAPAPVLHPIRDLPVVSVGAYQSNRRTADALFRSADNRALADLLADAIRHDGVDGVAEVRDLLDQVRDRSPDRADAMARSIFDRLPEKDRIRFTGGAQPEREPIGMLVAQQTSDEVRPSVSHATAPNVKPSEVEGLAPLPESARPLGETPGYRLDQTRRRYENYVGVGRAIGLDQAAKNLDRYLDGKGEKLEFSREEAREFRFIRAGEAVSRERFEDGTFLGKTKKAELNNRLRNLPEGRPVDLMDEFNYTFGTMGTAYRIRSPGDSDAILAFGETNLHSQVEFRATRSGDVVHIEGRVTHTWKDDYDFEKGKSGAEGALLLEREGRAARFPIEAKWSQRVRGDVRIVGNELVPVGNFQWSDVDQ